MTLACYLQSDPTEISLPYNLALPIKRVRPLIFNDRCFRAKNHIIWFQIFVPSIVVIP